MIRKVVTSVLVVATFAAAIVGCKGEVAVHATVPEPVVAVKVDAPAPVATVAVVVAKPKPPPRRKHTPKKIIIIDNKVPLPGPVVFESGTANLKAESEPVLEVVEDYLDQEPSVNLLRVEGHTDNDGGAAMNMDLSKKRSLAVAQWLVARGVDCKRLVVVGYGETAPIAPNTTDDGKAQNRRVDFVKAMENGKAVVDRSGRPLATDGGKGAEPAGNACN